MKKFILFFGLLSVAMVNMHFADGAEILNERQGEVLFSIRE